MFDRIVLTCEHGRNRIPARYTDRFRSASAVLEGHRGYDLGALDVARSLARHLGVPLFSGKTSRLLVDLNRSLGHSGLFSKYVSDLDSAEKMRILELHYHPYRCQVQQALQGEIERHRHVLHLSLHSFAPKLDGKVRRTDIGLLYDPQRAIERLTCTRMLGRLRGVDPTIVLRRNYPYRGTADGFTTHLRKALKSDRYAGIEIELNQGRIASSRERQRIASALENAIRGELR